ncbi:VWA domain-containing protein [Bacillus sp. Brlt_9]|uniref:VWA domain-containing protein n=1 Tax=Bacillus sp. Brlt_9 TaxID=3110916 RepID=UPI003F7C6448
MSIKWITGFAQYLREQKIDVPVAVVEEAIRIQPYLELKDKDTFRHTLKQIFIKDVYLYDKYEMCFEEYIKVRYQQIISEIEGKKIEESANESYAKIQQHLSRQMGSQIDNHIKNDWVMSKLSSNDDELSKLYEMALNNTLNDNFEDVKEILHHTNNKEILAVGENLVWKAMQSNAPHYVFDSINRTVHTLLDLQSTVFKVKRRSEQFLSGHKKDVHKGLRKMIRTEADRLLERPIEELSKRQIDKMRNQIENTAAQLLNRYTKILRQTKKEDEIDLNKTIENSLKTLGVPFEIGYRSKKKNKTKIDILLDVSGSVAKTAEFLTLFAYLIHKRFPNQVRIFSFVGLLDDVTHFFETSDMECAVENTLMKANIDYRGYSNYGLAFQNYYDEHMKNVNKDTVVFILGDARNNKNSLNIEVLEELNEITDYVFWLNSEVESSWGKGDSKIKKYAKHCSFVKEVTSIEKLLNALNDAAVFIEASKQKN